MRREKLQAALAGAGPRILTFSYALARNGGETPRLRLGEAHRLGLGVEPQLDGDTHEAQDAQRILGEGAGAGGAQPPSTEVPCPVERVEQRPSAERFGDGDRPAMR